MVALVAGVTIPLARPRIIIPCPSLDTTPEATAPSRNSTKERSAVWLFLTRPLLYLFALSMALQGFSNFLPATFLPSYAVDLGFSPAQGGLLITALSLSGMAGQTAFGWLADCWGAPGPLLLSTGLSTFAVLVLWGLGRHYWTMILMTVVFGSCSFSFAVFRSHMAAAVVAAGNSTEHDDGGDDGEKETERDEQATVLSGALLAVRGIAAVASGYMSAGLAPASGQPGEGIDDSYGAGKWRKLIVVSGILMFGASVGVFGFAKRRR
jgi:MFS family permease